MTDSIETSEREADEPRVVRLPVREASAEPAPPPVAAGCEVHPMGTGERLRRLDRVNAELVAQNEAQKNEWLSWDEKRAALELFAARWQQLEHMYSRGATADTLGHYIGRPERLDYTAKLRAEHGAALTSATKETT